MATIDITEESFTETLENNKIVFVDFWAAWCPPCRTFASTYDAAAQRHPDVIFAKANIEIEQALTSTAGVTSIPTLLVFKRKALVFSQPGILNATGLEELIQTVKSVDIDELRAETVQQPA